ncbi:MAG TPA: lytic transglycosylase domain-containing protein [Bryobacteraceae bacterium]|nr:lytic transglycosylase domain-containing protein [Bryobacteraceae bacterium]
MRILYLIGMVCGVGACICPPLFAGEYAVLGNGALVHADRHETCGANVRLYSDGGFTELPASAIARFEQEDIVTPPPAPPVFTSPRIVPPAPNVPVDLAAHAAQKYALPESFVRSVMKAESGLRPDALSAKGAIGLMQLMPDTARQLGVDPRNPQENAEGGAQYLRELLAKYEGNPDQVLLALAAYNAGPGAVEKYHGVPPFRETHDYILRVLKNWDRREQSR